MLHQFSTKAIRLGPRLEMQLGEINLRKAIRV